MIKAPSPSLSSSSPAKSDSLKYREEGKVESGVNNEDRDDDEDDGHSIIVERSPSPVLLERQYE